MSEPSRTLSSTEEAALTGYDPDRTSYCSSCGHVTFYWERYEDAGTAVDRAVDALAAAATWGPGRLKDPWQLGVMRGEFRAVLEAAEEGGLAPVDEVKRIRRPTRATMFEFRWPRIRVAELRDGTKRFVDIEMRLLEVETRSRPCEALGLRAFEKQTWGGAEAVRDRQNQEIDAADRDFVRLLGQGKRGLPGHPGVR